jgi:hypothetical protein
MATLAASTSQGKALFQGSQAFYAHDGRADSVDSGGTYSHNELEFSAHEAEALCDWARFVNSVLRAGVNCLDVRNETGGQLTAGTLVYVSGYSAAEGKCLVTKADADDPVKTPQLVIETAIANSANGYAYGSVLVSDIDTSGASAVGSLAYMGSSAGAFAWSSAGMGIVIGVCVTKHATTGSIMFFPGNRVLTLFDATNPAALGTAGPGTAVTVARRDHVHELPKLDDAAAPDDNADLDASTTKHGLLLKATAPAAGIVNVVAIANGETAYTNKALLDDTNPAALSTAGPGTATLAARRDHVHELPKLDDAAAPDDNADLDASTTKHGLLLKATAPAAGIVNVVGIANVETVYTNKALLDDTLPASTGTAAAGTATVAARRDHVHATGFTVEASLTASVTQSQGQQPLTKQWNEVSVCANANDVVTLPAAAAGLICMLANAGAETLQVYPASGDSIDGGAADASTTQATGVVRVYMAVSDAKWYSVAQ